MYWYCIIFVRTVPIIAIYLLKCNARNYTIRGGFYQQRLSGGNPLLQIFNNLFLSDGNNILLLKYIIRYVEKHCKL